MTSRLIGALRHHAEPSRTLTEALIRRFAGVLTLLGTGYAFYAVSALSTGRHP